MTYAPNVRKAALTIHVLCAVGWFGAVAAYLALALTGLRSADPQLVRCAYAAMALIGWGVTAPASGGALLTGAWWTFVPSGAAIALVAFALAMINYAVDQITNPRLARRRKKRS